jgi:HAMP domain-containing protein
VKRECATFKKILHDYHGNIQTDAYGYSVRDTAYILALFPIRLQMDNVEDASNDARDHVLTLGLSYKAQDYLRGVDEIVIFTFSFVLYIITFFLLFAFILAVSIIIAFRASHRLFRPLRKLNRSMREILADKMKRDLTQKSGRVSHEINELYEVFRSLIRTKKFENNDLIN